MIDGKRDTVSSFDICASGLDGQGADSSPVPQLYRSSGKDEGGGGTVDGQGRSKVGLQGDGGLWAVSACAACDSPRPTAMPVVSSVLRSVNFEGSIRTPV